MKRFYKQAAPVAAEDGFAVQLDARAVKTPGGRPLRVPTLALAEAVAREWQDQDGEIVPSRMPLTQLVSTALDRVGPERGHIQGQMIEYGRTDLLCYRAEAPLELVERQARQWQPLLDWARETLGADLVATEGIIAVEQSNAALEALSRRLDGYDVWTLTSAQAACAAAGSLILALALVEGRLDGDGVFALSQLDETYQIEQWGEDAQALARRRALAEDIAAAARLAALTR